MAGLRSCLLSGICSGNCVLSCVLVTSCQSAFCGTHVRSQLHSASRVAPSVGSKTSSIHPRQAIVSAGFFAQLSIRHQNIPRSRRLSVALAVRVDHRSRSQLAGLHSGNLNNDKLRHECAPNRACRKCCMARCLSQPCAPGLVPRPVSDTANHKSRSNRPSGRNVKEHRRQLVLYDRKSAIPVVDPLTSQRFDS